MKASRREFLGAAAAMGVGLGGAKVHGQPAQAAAAADPGNLVFVNGRIHTMDGTTGSSRSC